MTDLTSHKVKCQLYRIIGPFLGRRKGTDRSRSAHEIHGKLRTWFANIPGELQIAEAGSANVSNIVQMQAIALQLAYDNIQIVLHRQSIFNTSPPSVQESNHAASINQLIESALRTARVSTTAAILPICRSSHAAMHVAICLFTAGVLLAALHLEHSAVHVDNQTLPALENVILFFRNFPGEEYALATQSLNILEALHRECTAQFPENTSKQDINHELPATVTVTRDGKPLCFCIILTSSHDPCQSSPNPSSNLRHGRPIVSHHSRVLTTSLPLACLITYLIALWTALLSPISGRCRTIPSRRMMAEMQHSSTLHIVPNGFCDLLSSGKHVDK